VDSYLSPADETPIKRPPLLSSHSHFLFFPIGVFLLSLSPLKGHPKSSEQGHITVSERGSAVK